MKNTINEIIKDLQKCSYKTGIHELLSDIFCCCAIIISNKLDLGETKEREKNYINIINKYDDETQQMLATIFSKIYTLLTSQLEIGFDDYLGKLFMQSDTSNSKTGQFFTPYNISKACASCLINENDVKKHIKEDKILTFNEPSCGSGGMILAVVDILYNKYKFNYSKNLLVKCGDIDKRCVYMTYIQLACAGVPAIIYHQDALRNKIWETWETPAYIMQYKRFRNVAFKK